MEEQGSMCPPQGGTDAGRGARWLTFHLPLPASPDV